MSRDLKQDLEDALGWIIAVENQPTVDKLRARLERATVTEPEQSPAKPCPTCGIVNPQQPGPPTDASLLADLRWVLGDGWEVKSHDAKRYWVSRYGRGVAPACGAVSYSALRRPHGVRDCAAALKLLAGVE
jgi:hypothetical protein